MASGIYKITNINTNCFYIGSAINIKRRKSEHYRMLYNNTHYNKKLQESFNLHGDENHIFEVIANCPNEYLIKLEQFFITNLKPTLNIATFAGSVLGLKHKESSKEKMRLAKLGTKRSEETKLKISLNNTRNNKGKKCSDKTKQAVSLSNKTRVISTETRLKHAINMKNRVITEETRKKLSNSLKGIKIGRRKSTPVICLNNGKRYDAGRDAAKELNVSFQLISKVLKGQRNHTKGYKFIYA